MGDVIKVVAWNDPRCVQPLEAAAAVWETRTGIAIDIVRRPLTAFNDQPLSELAPICDVMIIDYPHIAQALREEAIIPIDNLVDESEVDEVADRSIGRCQDSFSVDDVVAAFASDAACHVAAYRPVALEKLSIPLPQTWNDVFALQEHHPGSVAVALYATDAISCLMSLAAGQGAGPDGGMHMFPSRHGVQRAIGTLARLASNVGSYCWECTPQQLFAEAATRTEIAYIPFTFGYTRMVTPEQGGWRFAAPPVGSGSLLGGAGMAVSSQTPFREKAAAFASWYCRDEGQLLAGRNWGQPSGLAAWNDPDIDSMTMGFYSCTRRTQVNAYVRPLRPWWPAVQDEAGKTLAELLRAGAPASAIVDSLEAIYSSHVEARRFPGGEFSILEGAESS